jgi:Ca2+-binding RTX toxin-like protein
MTIRAGATLLVCAFLAASAAASTSHKGWPPITGMLLTNKTDRNRPLDARPGHDPFDGADRSYSCDAVHERGKCRSKMTACDDRNARAGNCAAGGRMVVARSLHNELLGGHGNDTIHAGPTGDVLWGDYKPSGQPTAQRDTLIGGAGKDFIYAGHGTNTIEAHGSRDYIKAHFGRGSIDCGPGSDLLYISHKARSHYKIRNCEKISYKSLGF